MTTNRLLDFSSEDLSSSESFDLPPEKDAKPRNLKPPPKRSPLPPWRVNAIANWVSQIYTTLGSLLGSNPDPEIKQLAQGLIAIAEPAGAAWEKLAKRHEWLRRLFDKLMTSSDLAEIFWIHVPIFVPILRKWGPFRQGMDNIADEFSREFTEQTTS